jgi:hypothetical protein
LGVAHADVADLPALAVGLYAAAFDMARDRGRSTKAWLSATLIFGPFALLALLILAAFEHQ